MKKFIRSVGFALKGIRHAFATQLNFRIQTSVALLAIAMGLYFDISASEWHWVTLCIALVLMMELFNTGIEALVDLVSPGYNELAGRVKDVSAAAVLIIAIFTLVTGVIIFLPKILLLFHAA
ncbi:MULTISPECIES: diacylglycerol kinase family protein [unclassified Mucilaginibacter]|uniref:diacylglycerol kinase family protein n=1 Tax=unclassified Mucilaginibacter TaxID=2617802 RepID=UPI002AC9989E|nr:MULTISPECIES: diacylglycerol kinase family protein [unclassified Mucilaginibacter]MEB0249757.1 diacylglycerol kinase family protein [Mucilaginibacter sp. 5B2]MEB0263763.1 diacylglycerol kinase family protein [Mucilaginibacter sp. 10I4]MEB0278611.1 diacylglycerol kinase family protein [Mucilaginibacter sp. 10B2]MEB0299321.1 diacylglycerol kinase family protein [Mucilaginibacter sp. 5C4]WPX23434.1 diacylglycerol kinase family protein [Mucilaginibacter sp. 5C4]